MKKIYQIGLIPFLNSCPLGHGLEDDPSLQVHRIRPSGMAARLEEGALDVALVSSVDYLARRDRWEIVAPYGIGSHGAVWTVKIFSPVPMDRIDRLIVDADSHTAINLARVLVARAKGRAPELISREFSGPVEFREPTLLIGDKAWHAGSAEFVYDLGQAWHEQFGLPFVFAVWAAPKFELPERIRDRLATTVEDNMERLDQLAALYGPMHGFSESEAREYLGRVIWYPIDRDELAGLEQFGQCLSELTGEVSCCG